jgi:hypothetical protein
MLMIWIWKIRRNVGIMVIWESFNYLVINHGIIVEFSWDYRYTWIMGNYVGLNH